MLEAEDGRSVHPALGWSAETRYGSAGVGLLSDQGPPLDQLRPEQVLDHARRYFVRSNAALVLTGPVPEGLDLRVPDGPRPRPPASAHGPIPLPGRLRHDLPWPVLSFLAPAGPSPWLLPALLTERLLDRLRHEAGLSYSIDGDHVLVGDRLLVALAPDGRPGHETQLTEALWRAVRELAEAGPTEAELAHVVAEAQETFLDPRSTLDNLLDAAASELAGRPVLPVSEQLAAARATATEAVARELRQALSSVLLGVPPEASPTIPVRGHLRERSRPPPTAEPSSSPPASPR